MRSDKPLNEKVGVVTGGSSVCSGQGGQYPLLGISLGDFAFRKSASCCFTNLYILAMDRYGTSKLSFEYKALGVNTTFTRSIFN